MANSGKVTAWLAAQGWTFTEMTEAQKFEMRSTLNICGYATSGSKRQRPCARPPSPNGRCKTPGHGGAALKGIAHPGYKHGDYSRYSPTKWIHSLERAAKDPELFNLRRDVELAESGLNEALERMDLGIGGDRLMADIVGQRWPRDRASTEWRTHPSEARGGSGCVCLGRESDHKQTWQK